MKRYVLRGLWAAVASALTLCLLAGCGANKPLAPSVIESYYEDMTAYRGLISDEEARELCGDEAVGTVVSIERVEREYVPVLISLDGLSRFFPDVPLEQWEADYRVVTVEIDEVTEGTFFTNADKWKKDKKRVSFSLPIEFRELEYWDEEKPRYTGRKILAGTSDDPNIRVGDRVTLLRNAYCEYSVLAGDYNSFVYLGEKRLEIGWLRGYADGRYIFVDEPELRWRRNVIEPRREGETILEAAFITPMRARQRLSEKEAETQSEFVVRGEIYIARHTNSPGLYIRDVTNRQFTVPPLEAWDIDGYDLTVSITEIIKAEGDPLKETDQMSILVPLMLKNAESGREIKLDGVVPVEGTEVTVYWNEGYENSAAEFVVRTEDGDIDALFGVILRDPVGPITYTRID